MYICGERIVIELYSSLSEQILLDGTLWHSDISALLKVLSSLNIKPNTRNTCSSWSNNILFRHSKVIKAVSAQLGYTVPFTSAHARKYRTENKFKIQTILKLNTTQKSKQYKKQQTKLAWFSRRILRHSARKRRNEVGLFYNAPEPSRGTCTLHNNNIMNQPKTLVDFFSRTVPRKNSVAKTQVT